LVITEREIASLDELLSLENSYNALFCAGLYDQCIHITHVNSIFLGTMICSSVRMKKLSVMPDI
jgi:hypothetical protein